MSSAAVFGVIQLALIFLGWTGLALLCIFVHEAGHVVGGLWCGFRIEEIRVGRLYIKRRKGRRGPQSGARWGNGMVIGQFRELPGASAAWRCAGFTAAGLLANLIVAVILAPFCFSATIAGAFAFWLAIASLFTGILNLIPFRTRLGWSDGAKLFQLIFSRKRRRQIIFVHSIRARIGEIIVLARNKNFQRAIEKLDVLDSEFAQLPHVKSDEPMPSSGLRKKLEACLAQANSPAERSLTSQG